MSFSKSYYEEMGWLDLDQFDDEEEEGFELKTCIKCKEVKDVTEFYRFKTGYYSSKCKVCFSADQRHRYENDPQFRKYKRQKAREQYIRLTTPQDRG